MENDAEESNPALPIVPHNSVVDCRSSPTGNTALLRKERQGPLSFRPQQLLRKDANDGRAAIDSLKSRLYDKPENSEVFRAILRPVPPSLTQSTQAPVTI